ncbi:chalcone-flavanone isomerase-domain-containing protein [Globomyces pollinis-pini]|nr:chalcone-flavanone isomerase-domain-containing protein [Globomyces pollinis-pini]
MNFFKRLSTVCNQKRIIKIAKYGSVGLFSMSLLPVVFADQLNNKENQLTQQIKEPISNTLIPQNISLNGGLYYLAGFGVRQVTFLYVNAYTISLYVSDEVKKRLQSTSRWREEYTPSKWNANGGESNWFLRNLIDMEPSTLALQIIPVRDTDGTHLRNGLVRFLTQQFSINRSHLTTEEQALFHQSIQSFRTAFPSTSIPQGTRIVFLKNRDILLIQVGESQPTEITNNYLTKWFFDSYLSGTVPLSDSFSKNVGNGLDSIVRNKN